MKRTFLIIVLTALSVLNAQSEFQTFISKVYGAGSDADKNAVIDSFFIYARTKGIPFVEGASANFIYRENVSSATIAGDFNGWSSTASAMSKISGTNFFYKTMTFELDARLDYKFVTNASNWILDPENNNRVSGGFGPNSELAMPDYIQPWEINYNPNINHGSILNSSIASSNVGRTYALRIYLPAHYNDDTTQRYNAVYFQDGGDYYSLAYIKNILDNIIDSAKTDPLIAVLVTPNDRNDEYAFNSRNKYSKFFAEELVPFIDNAYRTKGSRESRLVVGDSYGGNISAIISHQYPEVFGNCGIHSGAFQPNNYEVYNLITSTEKRDVKYSSVWGTYEGLQNNMRNFRDVMIGKGNEFSWMEKHEGHSWGLWRATTDFIIENIFPRTISSLNETKNTPTGFQLYQNYPNPFNPRTVIKFQVPSSKFIKLQVHDLLGGEIQTLANEYKSPGTYEVAFNAENLSSGMYFYTLTDGKYSLTKKMIVIK
ncbi:MAG: T9SS type A sorting domain-containing protein [Bacteroidetes bacterium]|nr:T9SS type A sorting domain-containing protein [Bacteroidota bacterium]